MASGNKQPTPEELLHLATASGDLDLVEIVLSKLDVLRIDAEPAVNPLCCACAAGHRLVVERLFQAHPAEKWRAESRNNASPLALYVACQNGHSDVVELLLEQGWSPEDGQEGFPPLYVAAMNGHEDVIRILLSFGANINSDCPDSSTPLMIAAEEGQAACVSLLIAKRADVTATRTDGATALYVACESGHLDVVKLLIAAGGAINVDSTEDGSTPLFAAVQMGHTGVVEWLAENGADINRTRRTYENRSALTIACVNGQTGAARALIHARANVNATSDLGETPLYVSCREGFQEIVETLLECKADVKHQIDSGMSALHVVCEQDHNELLPLLLSVGADPNAPTAHQKTPLMCAVEAGSAEMVKMLLEAGADPTAEAPTLTATVRYRTALEAAVDKNNQEVMALLGVANPAS